MTAPVARGIAVPPFYAGEIAREAEQRRRRGEDVVAMHFGEPSLPPPRAVLDAAARCLAPSLAMQPMGYWESDALRARIAAHYLERYGLRIAPERILLTLGASAALVAIFTALFPAGARIGLARPGYPAYRNALRALQREVVEIDCPAATRFALRAQDVAALTSALAGLVVASPGNPTGSVLEREELAALAEVCRSRGTWFISDEIYHGISYGRRPCCALEVEPDAIVVNSFSKLYRMPGWRLGWLVAPVRAIEALRTHLVNFFLSPPAISQHAALAAFDAGPELEAAVAVYARNRALLLERLPALGLERFHAPDGAFYIYLDVSSRTDDSLSWCRRLLAETGVAITPGIDFDPLAGRHHVRLSFAGSTEDVERALERLAHWLGGTPSWRSSRCFRR